MLSRSRIPDVSLYISILSPLTFLVYSLLLGIPPLLIHLVLHPFTYLPSRTQSLSSQFYALRSQFFFYSWRGLSPRIDPFDAPSKGPLLARAHGTVLEVGPGVGDNIKYYHRPAITRLILVEPNTNMHPALRSKAAASGYTDKDGTLLLLGCGGAASDAAALAAAGIADATIDTVVAVHVLCGIPQPALAVELYRRLLRRGGQLLFYEHVRSADPLVARAQSLYTRTVWRQIADGCCLDRPTGAWIMGGPLAADGQGHALTTGLEMARGDGSDQVWKRWAHVEISRPKGEPRYSCIPHVLGWAIKV